MWPMRLLKYNLIKPDIWNKLKGQQIKISLRTYPGEQAQKLNQNLCLF